MDSSLSELDSLSDSPVSEPVWPRKMSEPPQSELSQSLFGKAMIFMVLPETIVIFGLVVAILGIFVMANM